jgi:hypothetical protein
MIPYLDHGMPRHPADIRETPPVSRIAEYDGEISQYRTTLKAGGTCRFRSMDCRGLGPKGSCSSQDTRSDRTNSDGPGRQRGHRRRATGPHVWSARPIQRTSRKFTPNWDLSLTYQQRGH